jgi:PQQ-dependent catabolism-associated CXXCW motif protein
MKYRVIARALLTIALVLISVATIADAAQADAPVVPEPSGYRLDEYRAPVPATVTGASAIDTVEAETLWREHRALFVDVLPAPRRPEKLPADALWKPLPRRDIPGSLWLPDVGRGALSTEFEAYFRENLERVTKGDKAAPLVLYCLADCWMSWNATKRAFSYGYTRLYWYRDGTTGWEAAALPTEEATPAPGRP